MSHHRSLDVNEFVSEPNDDLEIMLQKALRSADCVVEEDIMKCIRLKISQTSQNGTSLAPAIEYFIECLLGKIEEAAQSSQHFTSAASSRKIQDDDYLVLQEAVQKAEAEIRKHIRIEQQLKIYMEGLQEKVEALQQQLKTQQRKYLQLFESMKAIDAQRREFQRKLNNLQYQMNRDTSKSSEQMNKLVSDNQQDAFARGKPSSKNRLINRIMHDPSRKLEGKRGNVSFLEGSICVNLQQEPSKKPSMEPRKLSTDQSKLNSHMPSHCSSQLETQLPKEKILYEKAVRELTKTVQMANIEKRKGRRISKYKTEARDQSRNERVHSVCH